MTPKTVAVLRRFARSKPGLGRLAFLDRTAGGAPAHWHDIIGGYRNLILADPGGLPANLRVEHVQPVIVFGIPEKIALAIGSE